MGIEYEMSLTEQYEKAMQQPDMVRDTAQEQAIVKLETLSQQLINNSSTGHSGFLRSMLPFNNKHTDVPRGLYLWGGVGRGKTWLMNLFYEQLDIEKKHRTHFHHFMLDIHEKLTNVSRQKQKRKNPLLQIAKDLSKQYKVLCIDEFIVTNITDAMILSELLHALFKHRVCLVATSNRIPDDLYLNGLQRERFLPAINLIKTHTEVVQLDGGTDHRISLLEQRDIFYAPIDENTDQQITQRMQELAITSVTENKVLNILNRQIQTVRCSDEIAWFDFDIICSAPRAAQDYIALAQQFSTLIIANIPVLNEFSDDRARRFIYLIDELYDRNVKLIATAETAPQHLYQGNMLDFAFRRTTSRLIEMRSHQYLSQSHNPF